MPPVRLSRRDLFERCAAVGALVTLPSLSLESVGAYWDQAEVESRRRRTSSVPSTRSVRQTLAFSEQTETPECHWPSKDASSIPGGGRSRCDGRDLARRSRGALRPGWLSLPREGANRQRRRVPVRHDHAGPLSGSCLPACPLPGHRRRSQAPRHAAVLRDRSGLEGDPDKNFSKDPLVRGASSSGR